MTLRSLARELDPDVRETWTRLALDHASLLPFLDAIEAFAGRCVEAPLAFPGPEKVQLLRMVRSAGDLTHEVLLAEQEILLRSNWLDGRASA